MCALGRPVTPVRISRPFAGGDQSKRHGVCEQDPHARPEPALLDRITDEEEAAERERNAAGPDHPLRAETLLQADLGLGGRGWRWGWGSGRGLSASGGNRRLFVRRSFRLLGGRKQALRDGRRDRLGVRGFAGQPCEPAFEPGDPEFEPFNALPRAHRHDDADHRENRDGENGNDDRSEHARSELRLADA